MRDIKRRIRSVKSIENITNAMRLVSSAKLRRARALFEETQECLQLSIARIDRIFQSPEASARYLPGGRENKRACHVIISSNRGLSGSYNSNIIKAAENEIKAAVAAGQEQPLLVCIGGKGLDYFSKRGYEVFSEYLSTPEDLGFLDTAGIAGPLVRLYEDGVIDEIKVVGTVFVSTMEQNARVKRLLPFDRGGADASGGMGGSGGAGVVAAADAREVEYEPDAEKVFSYLAAKYVEMVLFQTIIEAAACEHAARRIAMQDATDSAHEMIESLELSFNRARQAAITREIMEIVSGAAAVRK